MLVGVEIGEASADDVERTRSILGTQSDSSTVHLLTSGGRKYVVVAVGFKVLENDLDLFESSLEYFSNEDSSKDLGRLLVHS